MNALDQFFSGLGKAIVAGCISFAVQLDMELESAPADPNEEVSAEQAIAIIHEVANGVFPRLRAA